MVSCATFSCHEIQQKSWVVPSTCQGSSYAVRVVWSKSNVLEETCLHFDSEYECFFNETAWKMTSSQLVGRNFHHKWLRLFLPRKVLEKAMIQLVWVKIPTIVCLIRANHLVGCWEHICEQDKQGSYLWGGCTLVDQDRYWTRKHNCESSRRAGYWAACNERNHG